MRQPSVLEEGNELPPTEKIAESFWGKNPMQKCQKFHRTTYQFVEIESCKRTGCRL